MRETLNTRALRELSYRGLCTTDLAKILDRSKQRTSQIISSLLAEGYISQVELEGIDKRYRVYQATEEGLRALDSASRAIAIANNG